MRSHLLAAYRRTGKKHQLLDGVGCPEALIYVWQWFQELSAGRGVGPAGPAPLTYTDIASWAQLTGTHPSPFDVELIKELDALYLKTVSTWVKKSAKS